MALYIEGQAPTLRATFKDRNGALADPTTVKFRTLNPEAILHEYVYGTDADILHPSPGVFEFDLLLTPGTWIYRWIGTGAVNASAQNAILVAAARV